MVDRCKKISASFLWVLGFSLIRMEPVWAQSTLEYGALVGGVTAAAAKAKKAKTEGQGSEGTQAGLVEGPVSRLQAETGSLISRGSGLLGQVGENMQPEEAPAFGMRSREESEEKDPSTDKIFLKNGIVIEGKVVEQAENHIRVEADGIPVTYFNEEIDHIEEGE